MRVRVDHLLRASFFLGNPGYRHPIKGKAVILFIALLRFGRYNGVDRVRLTAVQAQIKL